MSNGWFFSACSLSFSSFLLSNLYANGIRLCWMATVSNVCGFHVEDSFALSSLDYSKQVFLFCCCFRETLGFRINSQKLFNCQFNIFFSFCRRLAIIFFEHWATFWTYLDSNYQTFQEWAYKRKTEKFRFRKFWKCFKFNNCFFLDVCHSCILFSSSRYIENKYSILAALTWFNDVITSGSNSIHVFNEPYLYTQNFSLFRSVRFCIYSNAITRSCKHKTNYNAWQIFGFTFLGSANVFDWPFMAYIYIVYCIYKYV